MVMERPYNVLQAGGWELAVGTRRVPSHHLWWTLLTQLEAYFSVCRYVSIIVITKDTPLLIP